MEPINQQNPAKPGDPSQMTNQLPSLTKVPLAKHRSQTKYLFLIIVFLLGTTGYLVYQNKQLLKQKSENQLQIVQQPSPTLDPTANWITFTNSESGFELLHPSMLTVVETDQGGHIETASNNSIKFLYFTDSSATIAEYLVKADRLSQTAYEGQPSLEVHSTKKSIMNGLNYIQREEYLVAADITRINTYFKKGTTLVSIALEPPPGNSITEDKKLYDQILSTFKFTK